MKKVAMIIAQELFRDEEYSEPKIILERSGIKVVTASNNIGLAKGKLGMIAQVDIPIKDIKPADFDAVIFIGGPGSYGYHEDQESHRIARETISAGKVLGGICAASGTLAFAGVLKGKKATSFPGVSDILKAHGAHYTAKGVEVDGNIITADGPESAKEFGKEILRKLLGTPQ